MVYIYIWSQTCTEWSWGWKQEYASHSKRKNITRKRKKVPGMRKITWMKIPHAKGRNGIVSYIE